MDVDGVLTDGAIVIDDRGVESKHFHVRDGLAFALWHRAGKQSAILSGRRAEVVDRRAAELKIAHVLQGLVRKVSRCGSCWANWAWMPRQVCFVGDDLADMPALQVAGLAACPADAVDEVATRLTWSPRPREVGGRFARSSRSFLRYRGYGTTFAFTTPCQHCDRLRRRVVPGSG